MNREKLKLWIDALRSGEYQQTRKQLRKDDAFCCLGVLCDISKAGQWRDEEFTPNNPAFVKLLPPIEVWNWLGMEDFGFTIPVSYVIKKYPEQYKKLNLDEDVEPDDCWSLATYNDSGASFNFIADLLEDIYNGVLVLKEDGSYIPREP